MGRLHHGVGLGLHVGIANHCMIGGSSGCIASLVSQIEIGSTSKK
jgi:hypothetical protein